jgi:subfamily B ATP-binding cassette protein MsbA
MKKNGTDNFRLKVEGGFLGVYRRLLSYARPYWAGFLLATLATTLVAATETAFPALLKPLIDKGFAGTTSFQVWWVPTAVMLIFILRGVATFAANYCMQWVANNVLRDIRQSMFNKLLTMPASSFDARSSGQLISRIIAEVNGVTSAATSVVSTLVRDSLILMGLLGWLLWLNWKLTVVVFALLPFLAGLTLTFSRRMRQVSRNSLQATAEMTRTVEEAISGHRVIKVFQGDVVESNRFKKFNAKFRRESMRLAIAQALQTPISQLIAALGVAVILTIALIQARAGTASAGDFISFITAMLLMFSPIRHLADINAQLQRGLAAAESVFELIDEKSEQDLGVSTIQKVRGHIEFRDVHLSYPGSPRQILSAITTVIHPGETVALVGPSGGGKSSFINLLPRLYEPSSGSILIDGVPIRELTLASLRAQFALVSQDVVLFNDSIRNNLTYGSENASEKQISQAIESAGLTEFLNSLPEGGDTIVGDRGVKISGGQRQRLSIARALLKNAPILILDEATSSLDSKTEECVKSAIDKARQGRTTIVVAHRLSTISNADRILVIEGGRIVEEGPHRDLISKGGAYAQLYALTASKPQN